MTWTGRKFLAAMGLAGAFALGGCAYDDGYYGGVSVGTGYYGGGYYDDYWGPGYYRPGLYSGWYDGFYYPGSGYYVYDRRGSRHRWNDGQRRYWEGRREARRGDGRNWSGTQRQWQGDRRSWRDRWREGATTTRPNPPVAQGDTGAVSPRREWRGNRSMESRRDWGGARATPQQRSDDGSGRSRGEGRRIWRR